MFNNKFCYSYSISEKFCRPSYLWFNKLCGIESNLVQFIILNNMLLFSSPQMLVQKTQLLLFQLALSQTKT